MFIETVVYIQQSCANGQCTVPVKPAIQVAVVQPVAVSPVKVKVRNKVRLFGGCKMFKGCR